MWFSRYTLTATALLSQLCLASTVDHVQAKPPCSCSDLHLPPLLGTEILSFQNAEKQAFTINPVPLLLPTAAKVPPICEVNITLTHPGTNDTVGIQVWLPLKNWNGRFLALGGSAWAAGLGPLTLGPAVEGGFAAVSTDAGLSGNLSSPDAWALKDNGDVNLGLLTNFASRSVYEATILGKSLSRQFYGKEFRTYWNGCSTGGRQGLVAAQQYPELFDGILAGAPAIYWPTYLLAELWPQVVFREENYYPKPEELGAVVAAAVAACDGLDGVIDGVIDEPSECQFEPASAIGTLDFNGKNVTITAQVARILQQIWTGPVVNGQQLWYGSLIGAPLWDLGATVEANGSRFGVPFFVADTWTRFLLQQNASFPTSALDSEDLGELFLKSQTQYDSLFNSANPDLSKLQETGGKLIVWHGKADQLIFTQGSTQYRRQVEEAFGGGANVDEFFRFFLAPGVDHCGLGETFGARPDPNGLLGALISWVENGTVPTFVEGQTPPNAPLNFTRKICSFPTVSSYRGSGDVNVAESYDCI
ncbi:Tannase/feruloyl esterase [Lophiotrema nucula]|uniref:Carboxylic ester hydrolase n=1 Tax=Lophiotrema nucula TaxID=690887 RepID=A0A6A5YT29_9PLEO|nr:Tannase/feruloyl esterase [Lophiotrema nucula]